MPNPTENPCVCNKRIVLPDGTINRVCMKTGVHTCSMGAVHVINHENMKYLLEEIRERMLWEVSKLKEFVQPHVAERMDEIINDNLHGDA